jgi:hypothetical protein
MPAEKTMVAANLAPISREMGPGGTTNTKGAASRVIIGVLLVFALSDPSTGGVPAEERSQIIVYFRRI